MLEEDEDDDELDVWFARSLLFALFVFVVTVVEVEDGEEEDIVDFFCGGGGYGCIDEPIDRHRSKDTKRFSSASRTLSCFEAFKFSKRL